MESISKQPHIKLRAMSADFVRRWSLIFGFQPLAQMTRGELLLAGHIMDVQGVVGVDCEV